MGTDNQAGRRSPSGRGGLADPGGGGGGAAPRSALSPASALAWWEPAGKAARGGPLFMKLQTWPAPALDSGLGDQAGGARASLLCPGTTHQGHTHTQGDGDC